LIGEAANTNFKVFDIRGPEIKSTIYSTLTITSPRWVTLFIFYVLFIIISNLAS
jgi:hypothetical protein